MLSQKRKSYDLPHKNLIGRRLKYFRLRKKLSQLNLEIEAELTSGVISRIENGIINPTKETLLVIAKKLNLNNNELLYLLGSLHFLADENEINSAKTEVSSKLNSSKDLSYLIDDRWRFYGISEGFIRLLDIKKEELDFVIGKTTVETIVDLKSPVLSRLNNKHYISLLNSYLPGYYAFMSHMFDDAIYLRTVECIMQNAEAALIWQSIEENKERGIIPEEAKFIQFRLMGIEFGLHYSIQPLTINDRFCLVSFYPKNNLTKVILNSIMKFKG